MPYIVTCNDGAGPYGPFSDDTEAERYAALCDIDPACPDERHEVEYSNLMKSPVPYDEFLEVVRRRIINRTKRAERGWF